MLLTLRQERIRRKWSQSYVAEQAGLSLTAIQKIETGQRKPSYDVLVKLLDLFGYNDPRELFGTAIPTIAEAPGGNRAERKTAHD